jgi:uncharacterized protein
MQDSGKKINKRFKFDFSSPLVSNININKLKEFLSKDPKAVLIFYGGEPLFEIEKIKEIIDNINIPFRMQTNGKLLDKIPKDYLNKISKILISIDGTKKRTDSNKGNGTYEKVIDNLKLIRKNGYNGELIARMALSEFPDIYEQVSHLISLELFDSFHWQIDAGFYESDFNKEKFEKFADEYNKSLAILINDWMSNLKKGKIIKIYPFIGIMDSLLKNEKTLLRCGAGHSGYAIGTDKKIFACPITNGITDFEAGNLSTNPKNLKVFEIQGNCPNCNIKNICGGRCLYWNYAELWPKVGNDLICKTIKHLISELKNNLPEIIGLIEKGIIKKSDFEYEKYFGPEIIP